MRARNLKPGIYKNYELARLGDSSFRLFTGLWCMADRQGRLKDEPEKIQAELFPFRFQKVKVASLMDGLCAGDDPFIIRYEVKGQKYISISKFLEHQRPHPKEMPSAIPPCKEKFAPRLYPDNTQDTPKPSGSSDVQDLLIPGSSEEGAKAPAPKKFVKPHHTEVQVYGQEIGFVGFDAEAWIDHYEANGWRVGKNPMKDWKAAVRQWKRRKLEFGSRHESMPTPALPKFKENIPAQEDIFDPTEKQGVI